MLRRVYKKSPVSSIEGGELSFEVGTTGPSSAMVFDVSFLPKPTLVKQFAHQHMYRCSHEDWVLDCEVYSDRLDVVFMAPSHLAGVSAIKKQPLLCIRKLKSCWLHTYPQPKRSKYDLAKLATVHGLTPHNSANLVIQQSPSNWCLF